MLVELVIGTEKKAKKVLVVECERFVSSDARFKELDLFYYVDEDGKLPITHEQTGFFLAIADTVEDIPNALNKRYNEIGAKQWREAIRDTPSIDDRINSGEITQFEVDKK